MVRHYYDLWCLLRAGVGEKALAQTALFERVAEHRELFFRFSWVDYTTHKPGSFRLTPPTEHLSDWKSDYAAMLGGQNTDEVTQEHPVLHQPVPSGKGRADYVVWDPDNGLPLGVIESKTASVKISSAEWPGHAPCFDSTACASQRDSSSSILRTCSSDNTSLAYAAKASRAARPRFWNPAPSSAAKSSGMFTVRVIAPELIPTGTTPQIRKLPDKFSLLGPSIPAAHRQPGNSSPTPSDLRLLDFKRLFPANKQHIRWSHFRNEGGDRMLTIVRDE